MLAAFFTLAAQSPTRQATFRRTVTAHLLLLAGLFWVLLQQQPGQPVTLLGNLLLVAGIVEGAVLCGWRLTQLPKSQALEFLLVSALHPWRVLVGEALVGVTQLLLVTLAGLPLLALLAAAGYLDPLDLVPLVVMPFSWGAVTGLGLTVWAFEPLGVRRVGERVVLGMVIFYLIVGVVAGENLKLWLDALPEGLSLSLLRGFALIHTHNPFGVIKHWLECDMAAALPRLVFLQAAALVLMGVLLARAAGRLRGHFHELHYQPAREASAQGRTPVCDEHPLAWWAVKRVTRYSGRINLWLAGGFCVLYALYLLAGDAWPAWMGRRVFQICDGVGGVAGLTTGLVLLAAVPAAFQYGLWDSSAHERCRRLELLLLTELGPRDYWNAAARAAWSRGRGYFAIALLLWASAVAAGRLDPGHALTALAGGVLLWGLYFTLGFRAFAHGRHSNGLGSSLTLGLPVLVYALGRLPWPGLGALLPPGLVFQAGLPGQLAWPVVVGAFLSAASTLALARWALLRSDRDLRRWYDRHHGQKVMS